VTDFGVASSFLRTEDQLNPTARRLCPVTSFYCRVLRCGSVL